MNQPSRRELLGALGGALGVGLAGCAEINEGQFVVVNTLYQRHPQSDSDVQVRVTVENRRSDDERGVITVTLERDPPDGETQTWTEKREIDQQKGTSREYDIRFSGVVTGGFDRGEYNVTAELEELE